MISYYELLGLIKEGKQPDKVKYEGIIFTWEDSEYFSENYSDLLNILENDFTSKGLLMYKKIEIIEDKPKKIEKIDETKMYITSNFQNCVLNDINDIQKKINELIEKVNYLLEVDKHE